MARSTINLNIDFYATGDTEPLSSAQIADKVRAYLSVEMEAAGLTVNVQSAFLDYPSGPHEVPGTPSLLDAAEAALDSEGGVKSMSELAEAVYAADPRRDYRAENRV